MSLMLRSAARSDVGLVRSGNEDSGYAGDELLVAAVRCALAFSPWLVKVGQFAAPLASALQLHCAGWISHATAC